MFVSTSRKIFSHLITELFCLLSLGFFVTSSSALAADDTDSKTSQQQDLSADAGPYGDKLDKLENKLFQHTYGKDSPDDRLSRLENLIFGQSEKGTMEERVSALTKAVPNWDSQPIADSATSSQPASDLEKKDDKPADNSSSYAKADGESNLSEQSKYPAVSAMETKLLGKDYASDPIKDRLARLEKKVLGHVSTDDDLGDRVDHLKQATGVDLAKTSGSASDWLEDNDDMLRQQPSASSNSMDRNFGSQSQDVYKDMQQAYNSGNYPFNSAYYPDTPGRAPVSIKSFGLSQQVDALEHEIFHKTYSHDPLPARLNRLETTVFPDRKPAVDKPLPQRVDNLLAKVTISQKELQSLALENGIDTKGGFAQSANNNNNVAANSNVNNPSMPKQPGGLGKLMNSIGNMLSGSGMTGGYPMTGGNYVVDPRTGMLVNPATGTVVNPMTGTAYSANPYNSGYGYNPYGMGGMGGFGMSPFGSPYGMGSGFGFGGSGMGMGFGFR